MTTNRKKSFKQRAGKFYVLFPVLLIVAALLFFRFIIVQSGWDFIVINSLTSSIIASSIFIIGFLLSGVFSDYKEVDKIPSEMRSLLESIIYEGDSLERKDADFEKNNLKLKEIAINFIKEFEEGLSHDKDHSHMECALKEIQKMDFVFDDMESRGVPPNYMTRIKSEQSGLKKILLRVYHIQKTEFVPSVVVLVKTMVLTVVALLLFVKTDLYIGYIELGMISFILFYVQKLISVLEKPFRKGLDDTADDVSIFVLRELREDLGKKILPKN